MFLYLKSTGLASIVNPVVTGRSTSLGDFDRSCAGVAACVDLAIAGTHTGSAQLVASASSVTFETRDSEITDITELPPSAFPGEQLGVRVNTSSLAQGQIVAVRKDESWLGVSKLGEIRPDLENPDFLVCDSFEGFSVLEVNDGADVYVFSQFARPLLAITNPIIPNQNWQAEITTDGVYQGVVKGDVVALDYDGRVVRSSVDEIRVSPIDVNGISVPITVITLSSAPADILDAKKDLKLWFGVVPSARLVRLPSSVLSAEQIMSVVDSMPGNDPNSVVILDADGSVVSDQTTGLFPPIRVLRGLALATRGETIKNEILGSGNASTPFQSFRLKKSPLTYLADPTAPNGRRSTLEVHVNGQKWRQAQSFYGALPTDQIYVIRHDEDHQTFVVFGDGELGQRVPTGSNNVVATYRFGVGGNVPANSITQLKKPIKGIRKVFNPLPATGGKEPPTPEQIRREAPLGLLVLGRLVSLPDFEAETRRYGNVVNAKARWGWDEAGEDATIQVWFATRDAGDFSTDLRTYLEAMAEPNIRVSVTKAIAIPGAMTIDLVVDPRYKADDVELEVAKRLFDDWDGVLSVRNIPIGGRLYRSHFYAAIHAVQGVVGIGGISIDGEAIPASGKLPEGKYLDLENIDLIVGSTEAGKRLFGAN